MNNEYDKTLETLIKKTKSRKLKWTRLSNDDLSNIYLNDAVNIENIDMVQSFKCPFKGGFIYLIFDLQPNLFIQPHADAILTRLTIPSIKLLPLKNAISDKVDDISDFLSELNDL